MAAYTNDLRLKEIATGDEAGTWGTSTNTNLELIAEALSFGTEASFSSDANVTSTMADGSTDPIRSLYLKVTSGVSLTATRTLTLAPNTVSKVWVIENATSGSQDISVKQGTGSTVTIPNGEVKVVYSDGAGAGGAVVDAFTDLNVTDSFKVSGSTPTVTIGDGGEEDTKLVFDGNAKDFYVGLDDSADKLVLGVGSAVGTNGILTLDDDSVTIGDGAAVDTKIVFDGNEQDFYVGLDDSADDLVIGLGSTVGTNPAIQIDENQDIKFAQSIGVGQAASSTTGDIRAQTMSLLGTTPTLTLGDGGEEDVKIQFNGVKDFYIANDDSADKLVIGEGSTVGTNSILTITDDTVTLGDGAAVDTALIFDGNAQDFYIALDDSADDLLIGNGSTVGSNVAIGINASQVVQFNGAYTFPTSDGSADQVLKTNGSGALSFGAVSAGTPTSIADADGDTKVQCEESSDEDKIRFDTGGTERMRINDSGQVSINDTTDPDNAAEFLQVRGTSNSVGPIAIRNSSGDQSFYRMLHYYKKEETSPVGTTAVDITGSAITHSFLSDERLKDELGPADGMNIISQLNPIKFKFKDGTGTGSQGFTAQAFKQAFDNVGSHPRGVVVPDNADEYWYLDDKVLIPNLVKAIQELEARIATLEGS